MGNYFATKVFPHHCRKAVLQIVRAGQCSHAQGGEGEISGTEMLVLLQYGRYELADITREIEGKTEEEVRAYSKVFWERYTELADHDRIIKNIGESLLASHASQTVGACTRRVRSPNFVSASPFCCMPYLLQRRQKTILS